MSAAEGTKFRTMKTRKKCQKCAQLLPTRVTNLPQVTAQGQFEGAGRIGNGGPRKEACVACDLCRVSAIARLGGQTTLGGVPTLHKKSDRFWKPNAVFGDGDPNPAPLELALGCPLLGVDRLFWRFEPR